MTAGQERSDHLPTRGGGSLPPAFAPLAPLRGGEPGAAPSPPGGPRPRPRLDSSALRRNAPDRPQTTSAGPAPEAFRAQRPAPVVEKPAAPGPASAPPGRGRKPVVTGVALAALLVVVGSAVLLRPDATGGAEAVVATESRRVAPSASAYDPTVTLAADSERVETEVLDGGDLRVTHWISTVAPVDQVRLRIPSSPGLEDLGMSVREVVVAADGVRLDAADLTVDSSTSLPLPPAHRVYVQYVLVDAVRESESAAGRALATVTSLDVGLGGRDLARTQTFRGGRVLTLACLGQGAQAVPELCGTFADGEWQVASPADDLPVTVVAQLDLTAGR